MSYVLWYVLYHEDRIPGVRLCAGAWNLYEFNENRPSTHVIARLPGGVIYESADTRFYHEDSFRKRTHMIYWKSLTTRMLRDLIGDDAWERGKVTVEAAASATNEDELREPWSRLVDMHPVLYYPLAEYIFKHHPQITSLAEYVWERQHRT